MKKKIFALGLAVMMIAVMLTGCFHNDIGVKVNKDGTGTISATLGIEKDFYQNLQQLDSDPFEGKETTEYTYEDTTYVAYTEVKEYSSYAEMEQALLEMTYETELMDNAQGSMDEDMDTDESVSDEPVEEAEAPAQDNHIFSDVKIEKTGGLFSSAYSFYAVMNPQSNEGVDYDVNDTFRVTLSVELPDEITASQGGTVDGNKITFDISDITESQELSAACEVSNTATVLGVVLTVVVVAVLVIFFIKSKK